MVKEADNSSARRNSGMYARGVARREKLMDAAAELLCEYPFDELSLKIIARRADIPVGSAYHFYTNAAEVFSALAQRFGKELGERIGALYSGSSTDSWQTLFEEAVNRAVALYRANPAYCDLIIGSKTPPEIKLADRVNDERIGELFEEIISRHFVFQPFPKHKEVFFHATEIVDLLLSLSMIKYGVIRDDMVAEAKKAGIAYLREYLPRELIAKQAGNK